MHTSIQYSLLRECEEILRNDILKEMNTGIS